MAASDWVKMRTDLYRDPKVCVMADRLMDEDGDLARYVDQNRQRQMTVTRNVMRNVTVGALVTVWGVTRHRGKRIGDDLLIRGATVSVVDDIADLPGFGEAMQSVGWAVETEEGVVFPAFFTEYNADPSEDSREKNAERQRRYRERRNGERNVTHNVTSNDRGEERRDSVSVSVSEPTTEKRNGTIPTRYAANSTAEVANRDTLLAMQISKANPGSGASLKTIKSLDRHDVADWFCRHIATKAPLVGSTALDLLLVLCCARSCRMSSRRILKPLAAFAADLSEGGWLESAEGCGEEWEWLVGEMKSGRIKFTQQEVAA